MADLCPVGFHLHAPVLILGSNSSTSSAVFPTMLASRSPPSAPSIPVLSAQLVTEVVVLRGVLVSEMEQAADSYLVAAITIS